jgi:competence protein ComEA
MKLHNPLRNYLTPTEQKMLLFVGGMILLGCCLDFWGWTPLQARKTDPEKLTKLVEVDAPLNLDIRTASLEELITLPGIGEKRAADIIAYREKTPFTAVNQLVNVKGIGVKTYAKLLPDLLAFGDSLLSDTPPKATKGKQAASAHKSEITTMVNLNTASVEQLCTLVGIGEVKAKAIIAWREENGAFSSIEDFTNVKGIGPKTLEKNRHRLTVGR